MQLVEIPQIIERLEELIQDKVLKVDGKTLKVSEEGRMFIRNICMEFDLRLIENQPEIRIFSMTV